MLEIFTVLWDFISLHPDAFLAGPLIAAVPAALGGAGAAATGAATAGAGAGAGAGLLGLSAGSGGLASTLGLGAGTAGSTGLAGALGTGLNTLQGGSQLFGALDKLGGGAPPIGQIQPAAFTPAQAAPIFGGVGSNPSFTVQQQQFAPAQQAQDPLSSIQGIFDQINRLSPKEEPAKLLPRAGGSTAGNRNRLS